MTNHAGQVIKDCPASRRRLDLTAEVANRCPVQEIVLQFQALTIPPPQPHWMATYTDVTPSTVTSVYLTFKLLAFAPHTTETAALAIQTDHTTPRVMRVEQSDKQPGITVRGMCDV